ncbi:hypothetical protein [Microbispora sp. NPDC049633]|uniref:protein kinase domain-containing protein n=1 Tax=Microbispora sp. NPDC049633 TaxID=3154355 RepID=UPI0034409176
MIESNVLAGPDGPRVIDFGIARLVDASTTTGPAAGTPPYMAPEHFRGERIGPPADVFAWGSPSRTRPRERRRSAGTRPRPSPTGSCRANPSSVISRAGCATS